MYGRNSNRQKRRRRRGQRILRETMMIWKSCNPPISPPDKSLSTWGRRGYRNPMLTILLSTLWTLIKTRNKNTDTAIGTNPIRQWNTSNMFLKLANGTWPVNQTLAVIPPTWLKLTARIKCRHMKSSALFSMVNLSRLKNGTVIITRRARKSWCETTRGP